jgi:integrase
MRRDGRSATNKSGTFGAVITMYLSSDKYLKLADLTKVNYRHMLDLARKVLGEVPVDRMRPAIVQAFLDGLASKPGAAKNAKVALNAVQRWALVREYVPSPYTTGTEVAKSDGGHVPWTNEQVALAELHARPHMARVITLGVQTGQRRSDLVKMCWRDLELINGRLGINVVQQKTKLELWIPFTREFACEIETWRPADVSPDTPILVKRDGQPYPTAHSLSDQWNYERDSNQKLASLAGLHLHGLRCTAVVRLLNAGATTGQISYLVGMSEQMVARYHRKSVQKQNAMAAVQLLEGRLPSNVVQLRKGA